MCSLVWQLAQFRDRHFGPDDLLLVIVEEKVWSGLSEVFIDIEARFYFRRSFLRILQRSLLKELHHVIDLALNFTATADTTWFVTVLYAALSNYEFNIFGGCAFWLLLLFLAQLFFASRLDVLLLVCDLFHHCFLFDLLCKVDSV